VVGKGIGVETPRAALFIFVFFIIAGALIAFVQRPPAALGSGSPATEFSAARAAVSVAEIARAPHPIGSAEHDRVRDYLVAQLMQLGLTPEVQRTIGVTQRYQVAGAVENVAARLKGSSGANGAVALVAHYDSVPAGPGAGDDGAGVAAILETVRALRAGPQLRNDLIALITDGEEDGLLGASAFVAEHPWFKDVRVVVNLEARGNAGESQLFETSEGNGHLVQMFAQSDPHASGTSLTYEVYKHMPNDTDLTVFKRAGAAGMNFAFIGHWEAYHTPLDNPQGLSLASLQHHGENALTLARALGNADLSQIRERDDVFFALTHDVFVRYSTARVWPLVGFAALCWLALLAFASGAWGVRITSILLGLLAALVLLALSALLAAALHALIVWLQANKLQDGSLLESVPYVLFVFALLFAVYGIAWRWLRRKLHPVAVVLGMGLLFLLGLAALAKWMPGTTFVLAWPLLALLFAGAFAFSGKPQSTVRLTAVCLLSVPALLFFIPLLEGFFEGLGFTQIGAPLLGLAFAVFLFFLTPLFDLWFAAERWLPGVALLMAPGLFVWGAATTKYSADHPKPSMMAYTLDADSGTAEWASSAARMDPWTAQFVGQAPVREALAGFFPEWIPWQFAVASTGTIDLAAPKAELVENTADANSRTLRLRISSPRHARTLTMYTPSAQVLEASINGHALGSPAEARWNKSGQWRIDFVNPSSPMFADNGLELNLKVQGAGPVKLVIVDRTMGLPTLPGFTPPPRPADSMPQHMGDSTMVRRSFVF
jgi:hypothetical protein